MIALLGSLAGAALAWAWFADYRETASVCAVFVVLAGLGFQHRGANLLPRKPIRATKMLNKAVLVFVALTAVSAAAVIVVTVSLAADENATAQTKELVSALSAAATTFIAAIFVATDKSDDALGAHVKKLFYAAFGRDDEDRVEPPARYVEVGGKWLMPPDSDGVNALYGEGWHNIEGWGREARLARATAMESYLKS